VVPVLYAPESLFSVLISNPQHRKH